MLTVSRTRRFLGVLINVITLNGLVIGNLILAFTKNTTVGGLVMGYKWNKGGASMVIYFFSLIVMGFAYALTFYILWLVDVITMQNRNGTFAEKIAGIHKQ